MTTAALPGIDPDPPPVVFGYWTGIPDGVLDDPELVPNWLRVYRLLLRRLPIEGGRLPHREIGEALGLHPSVVNRELAFLRSYVPRGLACPLISMWGNSRNRMIRVLYRGKLPDPVRRPEARSRAQGARDSMISRAPSDYIPASKTPENKGFAARPLFEDLGEKNNVDVIPIPEECLAHARASEGAGPVEGTTLPAPSAPAQAPAHEPPPSASAATAEALRERVAELELALAGCPAVPARRAERLALSGALNDARAELAALEASHRPEAGPAAGEARSPGPRPAVATAAKPGAPAPHVETPDLIRRLISPAGPAQVEAIVARLCERVDPEFEPLYRKCCREVLAGSLDVGTVIGAFRWARDAPGRGVKRGPSFAAYLKEIRSRRSETPRVVHRRE